MNDDYPDAVAPLLRDFARMEELVCADAKYHCEEDPLVQHVCRETGCAPCEVTVEQRRAAKMACFVELYGGATRALRQSNRVLHVLGGAAMHTAVNFQQLSRQMLAADNEMFTVHRELEESGFVRSELGTLRDSMWFSPELADRRFHIVDELLCMDAPLMRLPEHDHSKAPQWHPPAQRDAAPSGDVPRAKVLKNRAAAKAARKARKKARK